MLILFDYSDMDLMLDTQTLLASYKKVVLVGWSMGVWAGQRLFGEWKSRFTATIAVNGTLSPVDDIKGIPLPVFDQMAREYSKTAQLTFYRLMCREKSILSVFLANRPKRSLENQQIELLSLLDKVNNLDVETSLYDTIVISENDFIMPTKNQYYFWKKKQIHSLNGYHFPFYKWTSWDEMVESFLHIKVTKPMGSSTLN